MTPLGLGIIKWYSIAIIILLAGYLIDKQIKTKEFNLIESWLILALIPLMILLLSLEVWVC